ncbi:hypothetical protein GCM10009744_40250 [Kribbella alba]|uniref:Uncharacterized protein n=1 Tax=Kribbella alba TaxID=190197 RepID=A0ABN2FG47_9ACTN
MAKAKRVDHENGSEGPSWSLDRSAGDAEVDYSDWDPDDTEERRVLSSGQHDGSPDETGRPAKNGHGQNGAADVNGLSAASVDQPGGHNTRGARKPRSSQNTDDSEKTKADQSGGADESPQADQPTPMDENTEAGQTAEMDESTEAGETAVADESTEAVPATVVDESAESDQVTAVDEGTEADHTTAVDEGTEADQTTAIDEGTEGGQDLQSDQDVRGGQNGNDAGVDGQDDQVRPGGWQAEYEAGHSAQEVTQPRPAHFGTPVRVDEIALAAKALSEELHSAVEGLSQSVESRQFRRELDEAADTIRSIATELETTAGNLVRLVANEGESCGVTWGVCPEHGLTLMNVGETVSCHVLGCYLEPEGSVERCAHPVAYKVVDAAGPALFACSGHAIACRLHFEGAVITLATDNLELL